MKIVAKRKQVSDSNGAKIKAAKHEAIRGLKTL